MRVERLRPTTFRLTLHAYEMAAVMAAARWVAEGAEGELDPAVRERLDDVLASYDDALRNAARASSEA